MAVEYQVLVDQANELLTSIHDPHARESLEKDLQLLDMFRRTEEENGEKPPQRMLQQVADHIEKLRGGYTADASTMEEKDDTPVNPIDVDEADSHYRFLNDPEMETVMMRFDVLEREILDILADFYIKMEYRANATRNAFYPRFDQLRKQRDEYADLVRSYAKQDDHGKQKDIKRKSMAAARVFLLDLYHFLDELLTFLNQVVKETEAGRNVIENTQDTITVDEMAARHYRLEGENVVQAVRYMRDFVADYQQAVHIPSFTRGGTTPVNT